MKILVVEDEQTLADIIGIKLKEEQFEVDHAYDGEQAYQALIKSNLPDLVLLDVLLPKMSGFDVLQKLKDEKKPLPKIIVFSNFAQQSDIDKARSLGAVDYIVKAAFLPAEILSKIKAVFAQEGAAAPAQNFDSMEDVKPMAEVLRPGEPNNNE